MDWRENGFLACLVWPIEFVLLVPSFYSFMSHSETHRISKAFLTSPTEGVVELTHDWHAQRLPPLSLEGALEGFLTHRALPH